MSVAGRHRTDRKAVCKRQAAITANAAAGPEQKAGCQQEEVAWQKLDHPVKGHPLAGIRGCPLDGRDSPSEGEAHQPVAHVDRQPAEAQHGSSVGRIDQLIEVMALQKHQ